MTHAGYASLHSLNEWRSVWTLYHLSFLSYVSYLSGIVPAILCLIVCWCTELIQCIYCMSRSTPHAGHAGWRHYSILLLIPYRTEMDCLDITFIFPLSGLIHFFGQKKCCTCIHPLYETSHRLHGSCACHIFFCTAGIHLVITRGFMLWKKSHDYILFGCRDIFRPLLKQL